jgi:AcrR family transcriptional regulator
MARKLTDKKKNEILHAAVVVFSKRDFHDVLTDDIAKQAGVGKGTIYRYFRTKDDLYFATLLLGFQQVSAAIALAASETSSPSERLVRLAEEVLAAFWNRRPFYTLLHRDEKLLASRTREVQRNRVELESRIQETIEEGISRGDFRGSDARSGANLFLGMVRAALLYHGTSDTSASCAREIGDLFLHGMAKRAAS